MNRPGERPQCWVFLGPGAPLCHGRSLLEEGSMPERVWGKGMPPSSCLACSLLYLREPSALLAFLLLFTIVNGSHEFGFMLSVLLVNQ